MKKLMLLAGLCCLQPVLYASSWVNPGINTLDIAPINASDRAKAHFNANYAEARDAIWYKPAQQKHVLSVSYRSGGRSRFL
ncbi:MAG: hypothetical protein WDM78_05010 [Puia sp.]